MKKIIIAIDGPAGSGKTTTAKIVAEKLGYLYIDTGAMYRAVALAWLKADGKMEEGDICRITESVKIELKASGTGQKTILNGEDVSTEIRTPDVTKYSSPISAYGCVRTKLVELQRELGRNGAVVMDGRDIGTVVFPNAELKIFLNASIDARAERRRLEMEKNGMSISFEEIKQQIAERDNRDSSRENSPLAIADDAIQIDTSELTIEEQCNKILELADKIILPD